MGATSNNGLDAERFAALWAGADTGNSNEAEAVNKFRAVWRMASSNRVRIVDCMTGRDDVMRALDNQMKPLRKNAGANLAELNAARERAEKLGAENLDLMRQVRELAGLLKQEKETSGAWARKYEEQRQRAMQASPAPPRASAVPSRPVSQSWVAPAPSPVDWGFLRTLGFILLLIFLWIGALHLTMALLGTKF